MKTPATTEERTTMESIFYTHKYKDMDSIDGLATDLENAGGQTSFTIWRDKITGKLAVALTAEQIADLASSDRFYYIREWTKMNAAQLAQAIEKRPDEEHMQLRAMEHPTLIE